MNTDEIDGIIKDWGERLHYSPLKGAKGRNIRSGGNIKPAKRAPKPSGPATRARVARTAKKTPEVMVKIPPGRGCRNMAQIKEHMDYIARAGHVELEDENGDIHLGKEALSEVNDAWAKGKIGIPYEGQKRKEAFKMILSMPPGTDRQSVKDAARQFAKDQFGNHQYVFASHEDENHPHVHLTIKAVDHNGVRMNPRKGDLQFWREQFAEKLRDQGIEANATPRRERGVVQKAEKQAVRHIDADFKQGRRKAPARVSEAQRIEAEAEVKTGKKRNNPVKENISFARKDAQKAYGEIAKTLATGDWVEKHLALDIVQLVQSMPPLMTKHEELVQALREKPLNPTKGKSLKSLEVERDKPSDEHSR